MKQPKKLTREQKECLSAHYLNCKDWMLVEETEWGIVKNARVFNHVLRDCMRMAKLSHKPFTVRIEKDALISMNLRTKK